jgi:luciferase family oxidoreductase group 1
VPTSDLPGPGGPLPLSILDLAIVDRGTVVADALSGCVETARRAERFGYRRVWYAEHHNMSSIASSATAVLLAHVAAHTTTIPLGSGGVMLPNHSPLAIAEQFGTLASLHPGRIELGLGRAPGTDQETVRALRRDPMAAERFPEDVRELQAYLADESLVPGVRAVPGAGTRVPLYILGSSLFGARIAAAFGLPYGFASHFAPEALRHAVGTYRREFRPSEQLAEPHVLAGVNVIAAGTDDEADEQHRRVVRSRVGLFLGRGRRFTEDELDRVVASPQGQQVAAMMRHTAAGSPGTVRDHLVSFATLADADELMVVHAAPTWEARLQSLELLAEVAGLRPAGAPVATGS